MGNDGGLTTIEMETGTLYMNPLYKKHEGRKGGKGRKRKRLSVLNKTLGTECSLRTTCIFLFLVTALFVAVVKATVDKTMFQKTIIGFLSITCVFSSIAVHVVQQFQEAKIRPKSLRPFFPSFLCMLIVLLVLFPGPFEEPRVESQISGIKKDYDTKQCHIITQTNTFTMSCMKSESGNTPIAREIHPLWKLDSTPERIDFLIHKLFSLISSFGGGGDAPCSAFAENIICNIVMLPCNGTCQSVRHCTDSLCKARNERCGLSKTFDALIGSDRILTNESAYYETILTLLTAGGSGISRKEAAGVFDFVADLIIAELAGVLETDCDSPSSRNKDEGNCIEALVSLEKPNVFRRGKASTANGNCEKEAMKKAMEDTRTITNFKSSSLSPRNAVIIAGSIAYAITLLMVLRSAIAASKPVSAKSRKEMERKKRKKARATTGGTRRSTRRGSKTISEKGDTVLLMGAWEKAKVAFAGTVAGIVGALIFWHGLVQESYIDTAGTPSERIFTYCAIFGFYCFAIKAMYAAMAYFGSIFRGVIFIDSSVNDERLQQSIVEKLLAWWNKYFGYPHGIFLFQKILLLELIEIVVQYASLFEICHDRNLTFMVASYILLFLNTTVSPFLLLLRVKCEQNANVIIYLYDSCLDVLFLFNNLWRGGDLIDQLERRFTVIVAIFFPAITIYMRVRQVYINIVSRTRKGKRQPESMIKAPPNVVRGLSHGFGSVGDVLKRSAGSMRNLLKKKRSTIEHAAEVALIATGTISVVVLSAQLAMKYTECTNIVGAPFWEPAHPKLMFKHGLFSPSCGFGYIKTIEADDKDISAIPDVIGEFRSLELLSLRNNDIKQLPCPLLMKNLEAHFDGNPVQHSLTISCNLNSKDFPTAFICQNLKSLMILNASNQGAISHVPSCVSNLENLTTLGLRSTKLQEDGLSTSMLDLDLAHFDFNDTPLQKHLRWRDKQMDASRQLVVRDFIQKHFCNTVQHIDLSGNKFDDEYVTFELLEGCSHLRILNMSRNKFGNILAGQRTSSLIFGHKMGDCKNSINISWPALRKLDLSGQPVSIIDSTILRYFAAREGHSEINYRETSVQMLQMRHCGLHEVPWVLLKQMMQVVSIDLGSNPELHITNADLQNMCNLTGFRSIKIKYLAEHSNVSVIPECFKLCYSIILRRVSDYRVRAGVNYKKNSVLAPVKNGIYSFAWPAFFSESEYLVNLDIDMHHMGISIASIPVFTNKSKLALLKLFDNPVPGPLPGYYDRNLPKLEHFGAVRSSLTGHLPPYNFSELKILEIAHNSLSGPIPDSILNMPLLNDIHMQGNKFNGTVPEISEEKLRIITCMKLHDNDLVGPLPSVYFGKNFVMVLTLPLKVHENSTSGFNFTNIQREASVDGYVKCHIDGEKIVCLPKRVVEENITELPCSP